MEVEKQMKLINKKYGIAEGDMHGVENDLDLGWDSEEVVDDFDKDAFSKELAEEIRKINLEHGLPEDEMHGLDLDDLDRLLEEAGDKLATNPSGD